MAYYQSPYMYQNQYQNQYQNYQNQQINQIIPIPSELDARNYPVANGNSVTFRDENKPYIYVKTMGYSQLDRPIFEKYKLTKEDIEEKANEIVENKVEYALKSDIEALKAEIDRINSLIKEETENE